MLFFAMWFHSLFDWMFSKTKKEKRRNWRVRFSEIAKVPAEEWVIRIDEFGNTQFSTLFRDIQLSFQFVHYGTCVDGMEIYCWSMQVNSDTRAIGQFQMGFHPFNFGPAGSMRKPCQYVDMIVGLLQRNRLIREKIRQLKKKDREMGVHYKDMPVQTSPFS